MQAFASSNSIAHTCRNYLYPESSGCNTDGCSQLFGTVQFASMGDLSSTTVDIPRRTLLDEILSQQKQPLADIISRITYVARFCDQAIAQTATRAYDKHKIIVEEACASVNDEVKQVTGFFLAFPSCVATQIEAKSHTINAILTGIEKASKELGFTDVRIISSTDDIPSRAHAEFNTAFESSDSRPQAEGLEMSAAVTTASEINLKFIAFGQEMRSLKGQELQVALENITTYWEGMPKADNVLCLLASGMVVPVSAFLELFDTPVDLDLESEKVWPVPRLPALKGGG